MKIKKILSTLLAITAMTCNANNQEVVWNEPARGFSNTSIMWPTRVVLGQDRTEVTMHMDYEKGKKFKLPASTMLKANGTEFVIRKVDGMPLNEDYELTADTFSFVMTFDPMPDATEKLDFFIPGSRYCLNIRPKDWLPQGIANTYWRNNATGDWLIGIAENQVIYQCRVLDIVSRTEANDAYTLTLSDGTVVCIGKMKKGQRTIAIGHEKAVKCSPITGKTLPDYPIKDTRHGFVDSGYDKTDSVTIVGWLKDMPQKTWDKGKSFNHSREFSVKIYELINENGTTFTTQIDSLGRFTLKIPIPNTSEAYIDRIAGRSQSNILEPGKTYFYLYDVAANVKLWMGDDARFQNEMLTHGTIYSKTSLRSEIRKNRNKMSDADFMNLIPRSDSIRNAEMAELQERIGQHPNLSQRYIDYMTESFRARQAECLSTALNASGKIPNEFLAYLHKEFWDKHEKTYTLYRDYWWFLRIYISKLVDDKYYVRLDNGRMTSSSKIMEAYALRRCRAEGKLDISDDELAIIDRYCKLYKDSILPIRDREKELEFSKSIASRDFVMKYNEITGRDDVKRILELEKQMLTLYQDISIIDSLETEPLLRDILYARLFWNLINWSCQPLDSVQMAFVEREIKLPSALAEIKQLNDKYVALMQRDISKSPSLKSADDVANMTEGEKILRKIIEPYKGRLILLDVWGTWCSPCKEALSHSKEEFERLKKFDLVYLYLANRSSDQSWKNVIKEYDVLGDNVIHYNLPAEQQSAIENFLNIHSFPSYRLIDRDGTMLDVNADPRMLDALAKMLEKMTGKK
ncbi:MAG: hypothetical protein E7070_08305 [Bacteroidales bacterium]|nr:hypothetical protein [Bacteroidales bacterium]